MGTAVLPQRHRLALGMRFAECRRFVTKCWRNSRRWRGMHRPTAIGPKAAAGWAALECGDGALVVCFDGCSGGAIGQLPIFPSTRISPVVDRLGLWRRLLDRLRLHLRRAMRLITRTERRGHRQSRRRRTELLCARWYRWLFGKTIPRRQISQMALRNTGIHMAIDVAPAN